MADLGELETWQHQYDLKAKRVMLAGSTNQILIDKTTTADMTYIGYGAKGLAEGAAGWLVRRIDKSGDPTKILSYLGTWSGREAADYE